MVTATLTSKDQLILCKTDKVYSFGIQNDLQLHTASGIRDTLEEHKNDLQHVKLNETLKQMFITFATLYIATGHDKTNVDFLLDKKTMSTAKAISSTGILPNIEASIIDFESTNKIIMPNNNKVLSNFSGGKDSCYVALKKRSLPVHYAKLDNAAKKRELEATVDFIDSNSLPKKPVIVPFLNSVTVRWTADKYNFREAATAIISTQIALDLGIPNIFLATYGKSSFSKAINDLYSQKRIPIKISTLDESLTEEDVTSWLIKNNKDIFDKTVSCLVDSKQFAINRGRFTRKHLDFPLLGGQCGYCDKDVRINMYRLLHDPLILGLPSSITRPVAEDLLRKSTKGTYDCNTPGKNIRDRIIQAYRL